MKKRYWLLLGVVGFGLVNSSTDIELTPPHGGGAPMVKGKFHNTELQYETGAANLWEVAKAYWHDNRKEAIPKQRIPLQPITFTALPKEVQDSVYRLGHSSLLLRLSGQYVLIDPVFSERASPVQWAGPKRFHPAPIQIDELPALAAIIISHDHYDHLDKASVKALDARGTGRFIVPLRLSQRLRDWGVSGDKIIELDWWQGVNIDGIEIIATPAQHFSGRGLFDRNHTLWASWVLNSGSRKLFYSGDTGYFSGFKEIGEKYGPFDLTMIETGAYNKLWSEVHMMPEQSLQAHLDLVGKVMMPVHNGTFDLALHDWFVPFQAISALAQARGVELATPQFGEAYQLDDPTPQQRWWQLVTSD